MRLLYASVTPTEAQLAEAGHDSLYHQWLGKRLPLTRIGYFSDVGEVLPISPDFEGFIGYEAFLVPNDRTSTLNMRIAVHISYDYVPGPRETPLELTNERSVTVAQSLLPGTMPSDRLPLARKAPGESTEQVFANASPPSATPSGESKSPDPTGQAAKRAKRMRQKEARDPAEKREIEVNKHNREYSFFLRVAHAATMVCPVEYYNAFEGMWDPPLPGSPFDATRICSMSGAVVILPGDGSKSQGMKTSNQIQSRMQIAEHQQRETNTSIFNLAATMTHEELPDAPAAAGQSMVIGALCTATAQKLRAKVGILRQNPFASS